MFFTVHFEAAFGAVFRKHAQAFASHFVLKDDKLFLRVTNEPFAFTEFHDWSGYADKEERVKRFAFSIMFQDFFRFFIPLFLCAHILLTTVFLAFFKSHFTSKMIQVSLFRFLSCLFSVILFLAFSTRKLR
jgi:hypothetical protein